MSSVVGLVGGLGCIIRPIKWLILLDRFLLNSSGIQPLRRLCQSGPFPGNSRSLATSRMLAPKLKVINNIYVSIKKYFPHDNRFTQVSVLAICLIKVFEKYVYLIV